MCRPIIILPISVNPTNLHRRRPIVLGEGNVVPDDLCELDIVEGVDRVGHLITSRLNGNVVILVKVDARVTRLE